MRSRHRTVHLTSVAILVLTVVAALRPAPALGWGRVGHRMLTAAAVDALPPALRSFYESRQDWIAAHSYDPDLWRRAMREELPIPAELCQPEASRPALQGPESPRHYIDVDLAGPYPFRDVPRDFDAYRQLAGEEIDSWGIAPWTIAALSELLTAAMAAGDEQRILCRSAILAHYVGDLAQPFHTTRNHNGQLSGLDGIHFRVESDLVEAYATPLRARVVARLQVGVPLADPLEGAFEMLVHGYPAVDDLLLADLLSQRIVPLEPEERGSDNPAYLRELWSRAGELVAQRMAYGASTLASFWTTAWDAAGRPALEAPDPASSGD